MWTEVGTETGMEKKIHLGTGLGKITWRLEAGIGIRTCRNREKTDMGTGIGIRTGSRSGI